MVSVCGPSGHSRQLSAHDRSNELFIDHVEERLFSPRQTVGIEMKIVDKQETLRRLVALSWSAVFHQHGCRLSAAGRRRAESFLQRFQSSPAPKMKQEVAAHFTFNTNCSGLSPSTNFPCLSNTMHLFARGSWKFDNVIRLLFRWLALLAAYTETHRDEQRGSKRFRK